MRTSEFSYVCIPKICFFFFLFFFFMVFHHFLSHSCYREEPGFSNGLNWALAGRGVIAKDKVFYNLEFSELRKHGAAKVGCNLSWELLVVVTFTFSFTSYANALTCRFMQKAYPVFHFMWEVMQLVEPPKFRGHNLRNF